MAANKKRKYIDAEWVEKHIVSQIPEEITSKPGSLSSAIKEWRQNQDILPSLPASSLEPEEVYEIFGLEEQQGVECLTVEQEEYCVPSELVTTFEKFKTLVGHGHGPNEALSRCYINMVIFSCIIDERSVIQRSALGHSIASSLPRPSTPTSSINIDSPKTSKPQSKSTALGLYFETELKQKVSYRGKQVILSGLADYSLGHSRQGTGSGNLVLVEAKKRYRIANSYGQLLAYMGICHSARKRESKENAVVFGVATDGFEYRFWRIDNASMVARSPIFDWSLPSGRSYIYSTLRSIVRAAILSTPTTSPVKDSDITKLFHDSEHPSFDFGVTDKWNNIFTTADDPDVEIVELPWLLDSSRAERGKNEQLH